VQNVLIAAEPNPLRPNSPLSSQICPNEEA
jgi:hypothetical protein